MAIRTRNDRLEIDVSVTLNGVKTRRKEAFEGTMQEAKVREAAIRAALMAGAEPAEGGNSKASTLTLERALEDVWEKYWSHAAVARTNRSHMKTACEFFGAHTLITDITTEDADRYLAYLKGEGLAASTIRTKCSTMTLMFNHFHRRGQIASKPYFELPKVGDNTRTRVLSEAEEAALLTLFEEAFDDAMPRRRDSHAGQSWADLIVFLLDTGCRPSEARKLTQKSLRGSLVDFRITKTNRPRTIPLTDRALEAFERQAERFPDAPFGWASKEAFRHAWDWARKALGFKEDPEFIPYMLRHTCATRVYDRTRDLLVTQKWLGHTTIQMTLRYAKLQPGDLERARDLLQTGAPHAAPRAA